jgi:outer membrane receptor protein involved in Fe transport
MKFNTFTLSIVTASAILHTTAFAKEINLDPIVVGADFREKKLSETSGSVSVITESELIDKSTEPIAEVLAALPNINFSSGASRAKYIQIRGMGETGQFETPLNPSVGIIVDGIDLSNAPLGAGMFDVNQIEVLRGPQGTTFGANALAGLVNVKSNEPTKETEGHLEATVGNYNTKAFGAAVGGALIDDVLLGRFSIYKNTSDGYIRNTYLNKDDTNNIDELTAKAKLRWFAAENHIIDFTFMHVDVDNGYDVFNEYNTLFTESNQPGEDKQRTNAFAFKSIYQINSLFHVESSLSYSASDIEYSYDEDWTAGRNWTGFDQYIRDNKQTDFDIRLVSDEDGNIFENTTAWTFGAYYKDYDSILNRTESYIAPYDSNYNTDSYAVYGQFDTVLNDKLKLITGARLEQWKIDFFDSENEVFKDDENLFGAKIGLEYQRTQNQLLYMMLSKGYKPGGFNPVPDASGLPKRFDTENLWNLDVGANSNFLDGKLKNKLNLFYGKRKDQQVDTSFSAGPRYTDYITNAKKGSYYGLEAEFNYVPTDNLVMFANLGLLKAKFDEFYNPVDDVSKDGRDPAQSPDYQYNVGFDYTFVDNWMLKANIEGKDSYYFSNSHDEKSESYSLLNTSLVYMNENWTATLWGRNLTDETYYTRGYFFDNYFAGGEELYVQRGTPRTVGLTVSYDF